MEDKLIYGFDKNGMPFVVRDINLATSTVLGVPRIVRGGNPYFDTTTGKFATGGAKKPTNSIKKPTAKSEPTSGALSVPEGVDPQAWGKRMDVARAISRSLPHPTVQEVRAYVDTITTRKITDTELQNIIYDAEEMRVNDVVDVIDGLIKKQGFRNIFGKKGVTIKATKGWLKSALDSLTLQQVVDAHRRLLARGATTEQLEKEFINRFSEEKKIKIEGQIGEPNGATGAEA